jgi:hypothetical protein
MKPDNLGSQPELDLERLVDLAPERRIPGRNFTKADLLFYRVDGFGIALKSYGERGVLARWVFGRRLTGRESSAYRAAAGVAGLPEFLGRIGSVALATEWVAGRSLAERQGEIVDPSVFDRLAVIVETLHQRGVAVADLHRGDILLSDDNEVFLIDFAMAWTLGERPSRLRRAIFSHLCRLDWIALARIRARFLGGDIEAAVREVGGSTAKWHRWGRRVKKFWDRTRGRSRR